MADYISSHHGMAMVKSEQNGYHAATPPMKLSIIIVNWNSREYLRKCLVSILAATYEFDLEIIVIDNASFDGCDAMLSECFPQVRFIQSDKNIGFARANNSAFNVSCGENILFLNPDTEVDFAAVDFLCKRLDSLSDAGIVGARLLNTDRSIQTSCIRTFPTILNQIIDANALRNAFPSAKIWGMSPLFSGDNRPTEVDAVSGACLMISRSVFEKVNLFSTDYFMYSEDIDLCFKVKEAGWKTYYVPQAVVVHHGGTSSSQSAVSAFSSVMLLESRWRFFRKTRSGLYCLAYRASVGLASICRIAMALPALPIYGARGKGAAIVNIIKKWTARLRWAMGAEGWVKDY